MSLIINNTGDPVHKPKRRDVFEFDEEVSQIFENMAIRSIPMYAEMHKLFAEFVLRDFEDWTYKAVPVEVKETPHYRILDIGASTGVATKMLWHAMNINEASWHEVSVGGLMSIYSLDPSTAMLDKIKETFPWMNCINGNVKVYLDPQNLTMKFNVIYAAYTLQFTGSRSEQIFQLGRIAAALEDSGYFLFAHKESDGEDTQLFSKFIRDQYYKWRMDNGYTMEEILAKTESLRGSMWTVARSDMERHLRGLFVEVAPMTRWGPFSSYICRK